MRIFIDSMTLLRIESDAYITDIKIPDYTIKWVKNEGYNQYFVANRPLELHLVDEIEINHQTYPVEVGLVTLTKEFENRFRYDGKLGYDYGKTSTKFTVFSPVAKEINVVIDEIVYPMTYHEPVWERVVDGDMLNKKYHYQVRLVNAFKDVLDPYADAMAYDGSYIIDWDALDPIMPTPITLKHMTDAVIYEGHVRDLSVHLDVKHPGLFEGLIEDSKLLKGSVLNYIKKLGMTHLQLLPVFDFEGVNDTDKKLAYNWGYNPSCYFAVEGWFSKDPYNPYDRINAFRSVVNEAHRMKLGINMDVVYNHVFNHKT
ncbi:MAG TPA: alpha-amylase family glycosyl hydrolase, partial [Acholeplasmataceae bacterium]|nr:alpha-amylase family glycosyl hydrolase [Acholeplasmataceae bacterium]